MRKLANFLDGVLVAVALYLLSVILGGYFIHTRTTLLAFSAVLALGGTYFFVRIARRRRAPRAHAKRLEGLRNAFLFSPPSYAEDFVASALARRGTVRRRGNLLYVGKAAFAVALRAEKLSLASLATLYARAARAHARYLVVLTALGASAEAADTAPALTSPQVEILDFEQVYDLLCELGQPPAKTLTLAPRKPSRKERFAAALAPRNARRYLCVAVVTLLFARFVPYAVWYVCIAAVCLTLALLCRLLPAEKRDA